ncbi:54S ribosomal protein L12, mitochondrial [Dispira parvispora]|uniref:54S ribosomal protein L12, mitochondrial n=1 Tax=Dispira parvispora TaxID=1520584 RepID=A0A9W8AKQ6_9FUNG|nr:54S ribosomal protein L12, mitochondrial [Dispira parvispora]
MGIVQMRSTAFRITSNVFQVAKVQTFGGQYMSARALSYTQRLQAEAAPAKDASSDSPKALDLPTVRATGSQDKLQKIVGEIEKLNLLETADLVDMLKARLNIKDMAMPMMAGAMMGGAAAGGAPAAAAEEKPVEKTEFKVKLEKFEASGKAKIIREVKGMVPNMNLIEAKKFVEGAPKVIKDNVPKEEAEKIKKTLEALGATIVLE